MRRLIFLLFLLLAGPTLAAAPSCPTTPSLCPSPTYYNLTVGGTLTVTGGYTFTNAIINGGTITGAAISGGSISGATITGSTFNGATATALGSPQFQDTYGYNVGTLDPTAVYSYVAGGYAGGGGYYYTFGAIPGYTFSPPVPVTGTENTYAGFAAGTEITTGQRNACVGAGCQGYDTTGSFNSGLGNGAMHYNLNTTNSVAVGHDSLRYGTNNIGCIAIGLDAIQGQTGSTCSYDIAIGVGALGVGNNTATLRNWFAGAYSGAYATTAADNDCTGYYSCLHITSGQFNVVDGNLSLYTCTSCIGNAVFGHGAYNLGTGDGNTISGTYSASVATTAAYMALYGYQSGVRFLDGQYIAAFGAHTFEYGVHQNDIAVLGYAGLQNAVSGDDISGVGAFVFNAATTGSNLTGIGAFAGKNITTGSFDTIVGVCGTTLVTGNNNLLLCTNTMVDVPSSSSSNMINLNGMMTWNASTYGTPGPTSPTACGSGGAVAAGGNNARFKVTVGTGTVTTCGISLDGSGYNNAPYCVVSPHQTDTGFSYSVSTTIVTINGASMAGEVFDVLCSGY